MTREEIRRLDPADVVDVTAYFLERLLVCLPYCDDRLRGRRAEAAAVLRDLVTDIRKNLEESRRVSVG